MKNDTTFVCMRTGDHLGERKNVERAPRSVEFNLLIAINRTGFRRMKEEGQIYKTLPQTFNILPRDLVIMIFQNLVMISFAPFFRL